MSRACLGVLAALLLTAVTLDNEPASSAPADARPTLRISADDLDEGKVVVIGRLGVPLKTLVTVRGAWRSPDRPGVVSKDRELRFDVTHLDGKPLSAPVEFHRRLVEVVRGAKAGAVSDATALAPAAGDIWEFRGYETGAFLGGPVAGDGPVPPSPVWKRHFTTELRGTLHSPDKSATDKR